MGGDHKCPLCSATFTRPQHVGRHLRAHTGDRPYECKECPLRFARSDLLSRHVNKAHPKPSGNAADNDKKGDKKSRRKSVSNPAPPPAVVPATATIAVPVPSTEPTPYQAQRMYPNHPLLQQTNGHAWASTQLDIGNGVYAMPVHGDHIADGMASLGNQSGPSLANPFGVTPMRFTGSDQGSMPSYAGSLPSTMPNLGFELSLKKRACDQCNHSKVRCDFAEPCARCSHRSMQCTYTKPQRSRTVAYPVSSAIGGHNHGSPTSVFSPQSTNSPMLPRTTSPTTGYSERRESVNSNSSLQQGSFLTSDALFGVGRVQGRPPVPDPRWEQASGRGFQTSQNSGAHQSPTPTVLGLALTPTLTNSTSPTTSDSADRRGSQNSAVMGNWMLPPSMSTDSGMAFPNSMAQSQPMDPTTGLGVMQGNQPMLWSSTATGDMRLLNPGATGSEDEGTPPNTAADKFEARRRSSAGLWANALSQMRLDDHAATQGMSLEPSLGGPSQMQFTQLRQTTFPMAECDLPPNPSRVPSSNDVSLWKLFLDPMALATPERTHDFDPVSSMDTPRGLSKSNSMPDLTTPPHLSASYGVFPYPGPIALPGDQANGNPDDPSMSRWKDHIQQRHASFSMHLDPSNRVSTQALTNATFASSSSKLGRPPLHPTWDSAALQQTLAPARTPSFGTPTVDQNGMVFTPSNMFKPSPSKLNMYSTVADARPGNKRQASQTLLQDTQKRAVFSVWDEQSSAENNAHAASQGLPPPQHVRSLVPQAAAAQLGHPLHSSWPPAADPSRATYT